MAINNIGFGPSVLGQSVLNVKNQLTDLQTQLSSGKKSSTYAGMGPSEGFAVAARAQLQNISAFTDTITNVNTTIGVENTALQALVDGGQTVHDALVLNATTLNSSGQTNAQQIAAAQLGSMLGILNTQSGGRYVFSGSATDTPSVASMDDILNGTVTQAGLKQVISERQTADLGTGSMARLTLSAPNPTSVALTEDGSVFGLKLNSITSSLTGSTVVQPAGAPPVESIDLGAVNPNPGEDVTFTFNLPDGTTESIKLTATNTAPPPTGSFTIGANTNVTATNLTNALTTAIQNLSNTSLVAASAIAATNNFFSEPPQRVSGTPLATAMTLTNGAANTVAWYTGHAGPGSARGTAVARIDQSIIVKYGARANEQAIRSQLQSIAVLAAVQTSPANPNATAQISALMSRVTQNMPTQPGQQSFQDIQSDLANAQSTMKAATERQKQAQSMLQGVVDSTESITSDEVISRILALQTSLQASYQTTSMLSQLSLVKFLPVG
ncbi:MAG: flagellar biosynthesis protein FlgL [Xanthobacteraceae bacterium]